MQSERQNPSRKMPQPDNERSADMIRIISSTMALMLTALLAGCNGKPTEDAPAVRFVSVQRLATYSPLKRLTYRNVCRDAGTLTFCVERISLSDTAAVVELRIINRSGELYRPEKERTPVLLLSSSDGTFMQGRVDSLAPIAALGEKYLYCRVDGRLSGELKTVLIEDARNRWEIVDIELPSS